MTLVMAKYLGLFVSEASDHLAKVGAELVRLEEAGREGGDAAAIVDELFRHFHSVKGMSASLELDGIAALAHRAEDLVGVFRGGRALAADAGSVDLLLATVDGLTAMVERVRAGESPAPDAALLERVTAAAAAAARGQGKSAPAAPAVPAPPAPAESDGGEGEPPPGPPASRPVSVEVRVAPSCPVPAVRGFLVVKRLERLGRVARASPTVQELRAGQLPGGFLEVALETAATLEEVEHALSHISELDRVVVRGASASPRLAAPAPVAAAASALAAAAREARDGQGGRTVRVRVELLDAFLDAVGELILATDRLREIGRGLPAEHRPGHDEGVDRLHTTVKDLHDQVMAVRMTPLSVATERLPRAARDLARRTGRQVEVDVRGAEIEIDRAILDELADPLLHVLRNAVDHGLEPPEVRRAAGKPATGRITITARRDRDRVIVEVADDGKGMDPERLRASAVARGVLDGAAARALCDRDALMLACLPGVSTAQELTEVSGRGVGMDAVKRTVEALGGAIDVESAPGAGTRWVLRLPLTVVVQPVLLVAVGSEVLGLPIAKVHGATQVDLATLERQQGAPVLLVQGRPAPVRDLGELLGFGAVAAGGASSVVIAEAEGGHIGLVVDALLGQREAVLKPLLRPFDQVPGLSAVTVLASGRPVFILDVPRLHPA